MVKGWYQGEWRLVWPSILVVINIGLILLLTLLRMTSGVLLFYTVLFVCLALITYFFIWRPLREVRGKMGCYVSISLEEVVVRLEGLLDRMGVEHMRRDHGGKVSIGFPFHGYDASISMQTDDEDTWILVGPKWAPMIEELLEDINEVLGEASILRLSRRYVPERYHR